MDASRYTRGAYLSAADITSPIVTTIENVREERVGEDLRLVISCGDAGAVVLNKTNTHTLIAAYGSETQAWYGKRIKLCVEQTTFQGKPTPCIRIHTPAAAKPRPVDEVPF